MELLDLQYLILAADAGKFALAAGSLGVNTSTISRRIGDLEDELGLSFFERDHAGLRLTAGGRSVLLHARRILVEVEAMKRVGKQYASGSIGEVRLGVRMPPIGGPARSLLMAWRVARPDVALTVVEGNHRDIAVALNERRLDVALISGRTVWPQIEALPLFRERFMAGLPAEHPLSGRSSLDWASLSSESILVQGWDDDQTQRAYYGSLLGNAVRFQSHMASKQTILALVGAGAGITLVSESQAEATFPGVVFRPIDEENAWLEFDLIWHKDTEDPVVGRFVSFMRDQAHARNLL